MAFGQFSEHFGHFLDALVIAIGFVVFSELPDVWTIIGGTVIFAASIFAGQTESRRSRKPDT